jgi:predicted RNase H-like HicB family nuclease
MDNDGTRSHQANRRRRRQIAQRGSHRQYKHHEKAGKVTVRRASKNTVECIETGRTQKAVRGKLMAATKKFLVVYEVGERNLSGFVPDVPGVVATAEKLEQMRQVMREALEFHLEGLVTDGDPIPESATTSVDFAEEDPEHGVLSCIVEWLEVAVPQYQPVA